MSEVNKLKKLLIEKGDSMDKTLVESIKKRIEILEGNKEIVK